MNSFDLFGIGTTLNYTKSQIREMQLGAKNILKVQSSKSSKHPYLAFAQRTKDDKQFICDGYRAIVLNINLDLPQPANPDDFIQSSTTRSLMGFIEKGRENKEQLTEIPTVETLKKYIEEHKEEVIKCKDNELSSFLKYSLTDKINVNVYFLIDMLRTLDNPKIYLGQYSYSPIYFVAKNGEGILLPYREK